MKRYANIFFAVLMTASLAFGNSNTQAEYTFTIHVGAFVKAKVTDFENIRPYGYLYTQKLNNLIQIYMGDYPTESDAIKVMNLVKEEGYPAAFVTRRNLDSGVYQSIIQLGSEKVGAPINWADFVKAGPLQTYQDGNSIKIVTGPFNNLDEAQARLNQIKSTGLSEAFIKNVNSLLLHKVTDFETGGGIQLLNEYEEILVAKEVPEEVLIEEIPAKTKKKSVPNVMIKKKKKKAPVKDKVAPKGEPRPKTYEHVGEPIPAPEKPKPVADAAPPREEPAPKSKATPAPAPIKKAVEESFALPYIRPKVKRTSVLKLQEVLKLKGTYKSGLDGYYGKGTRKGYKDIMAENKDIKRFKLLAQMYEEEASKKSALQTIINKVNNDVAISVSKLKGYQTPVAKAYQAYGIFALSGKNQQTDRLMGEAIKASFSKSKLKNKSPFDFEAKHSYSDYTKLIKHIRYIHGASNEDIAVPCWLFEDHKKEAMAAFDPSNDLASEDYTIQDCGNIMAWESLSLLETIMKDMTPELSKVDIKNLKKWQSKRAMLLIAPKAQSTEDYKSIDAWNTNLWNGLNTWEKSDPIHSKMTTPLKIAYFQSWALLEDYFMNKGLKAKEARGLSLSVLQSIVDPYLGRYAEKK